MNQKTLAFALVGSIAGALGVASLAQAAQPAGTEVCYGVSMKGHNDCAAGAHSCAGHATRDNDPASFVELPAGACAKIAHGSLTAGH